VKRNRTTVLTVIGVVLIAVGILVAALPKEWIEETFKVDPDEGSGFVELLIALVPIVAGVAFLVYAYVSRRNAARSPSVR
jgi:uncharacterized membrane protein